MHFVIVASLCAMSIAAFRPPLSVSVNARAIQPGELVVLAVTDTAPITSIRATAFDRDLPTYLVGDRRWHVLVGIDLETRPGKYIVAITADGTPVRQATHTLTVTPKTFRTRQLTVDQAFVNPPQSAAERIRLESELLAKVWSGLTPERLWRGPFVRPVPHPANSAFGTRSVFNGEARSPHSGADFSSPAGTPVRAPNAGRIALARDLYFSGQTVIIDHGLGIGSHLGHLSAIDVTEGVMVDAGDVIGKVGATGRVTGAHLHWSVRAAGARVDPLSLLALLGDRAPIFAPATIASGVATISVTHIQSGVVARSSGTMNATPNATVCSSATTMPWLTGARPAIRAVR
jgi:murein DD-endopeptidase MepM/ murein hydrolase activator NlpD